MFSNYRAVFVRILPLTKECLSLTHSFCVISLNVPIYYYIIIKCFVVIVDAHHKDDDGVIELLSI